MESYEKLNTSDSNSSEKENREYMNRSVQKPVEPETSFREIFNASLFNKPRGIEIIDTQVNDKFKEFFDLLNIEKQESKEFESKFKSDKVEQKKRAIENGTPKKNFKQFRKEYESEDDMEMDYDVMNDLLPQTKKSSVDYYNSNALDDLLKALNEEKSQTEFLDKKFEETLNDFY